MSVNELLQAALAASQWRWPVGDPPDLPSPMVIGWCDGTSVIWPATNASLDSLNMVEINGVKRFVGSLDETCFDEHRLRGAINACWEIANQMELQSQRLRILESLSLAVLEQELERVKQTEAVNLTHISLPFHPLAPLAARISAMHSKRVPSERVVKLAEVIMRQQIRPARIMVDTNAASVEASVYFWRNRKNGWVVLKAPRLHAETTDVCLIYTRNEEELQLRVDNSILVDRLALVITRTPREAESLLSALDSLKTFLSGEQDEFVGSPEMWW